MAKAKEKASRAVEEKEKLEAEIESLCYEEIERALGQNL